MTPLTSTERRARAGILALAFLDLAGFGMLIPSVQLRAESLGARGWLIGAVLASMFVVQTIASPLWGGLSDRVGRKPVVLACTALSAVSMLVYAHAASIWIVLAARVLAGLGAANVSTGTLRIVGGGNNAARPYAVAGGATLVVANTDPAAPLTATTLSAAATASLRSLPATPEPLSAAERAQQPGSRSLTRRG